MPAGKVKSRRLTKPNNPRRPVKQAQRPKDPPNAWEATLDRIAVQKLVLELRNEGTVYRRRDQYPPLPQLRRMIKAELDRVLAGTYATLGRSPISLLPEFMATVVKDRLKVRMLLWERPETPIQG